jgi:SAM-dependent methyltransferase
MKKLLFPEFNAIYQSSVDEIWPYWNEEMQLEIARHCVAWSPGRMDFLNYLRVSSIRFFKAYEALISGGGRSVCDVGGFWGVWPVTAEKLGFEVSMTESLKYYGESFTPLFRRIEQSGVTIYDHDPFSPESDVQRKFDLVTVMAVLEHYPHSLKVLIENIKGLTADGGRIFLEAPNIAYWPKRTALLRGHSPLAELGDIYVSEEPFIGHHHEFTLAEMRELARLGGLRIISEDLYNYTLSEKSKLKLMLRHPVMSLAFQFSKASRECISVLCDVEG